MDDRLISFNAAIDALEKEKPTPFVNKDGSVDPFGAGRQNQWYRDGIAIMNLPTVDAVPVTWIEGEIKWLKEMDNPFATMSAGQIEAMLKRWKDGDGNG